MKVTGTPDHENSESLHRSSGRSTPSKVDPALSAESRDLLEEFSRILDEIAASLGEDASGLPAYMAAAPALKKPKAAQPKVEKRSEESSASEKPKLPSESCSLAPKAEHEEVEKTKEAAPEENEETEKSQSEETATETAPKECTETEAAAASTATAPQKEASSEEQTDSNVEEGASEEVEESFLAELVPQVTRDPKAAQVETKAVTDVKPKAEHHSKALEHVIEQLEQDLTPEELEVVDKLIKKQIEKLSAGLDKNLDEKHILEKITQIAFSEEAAPARTGASAESALARDALLASFLLKQAGVQPQLTRNAGPSGSHSNPLAGIQTGDGAINDQVRTQKDSAEKTQAQRPLPRPLAVRTMERIESVLREAAKSRDGETISLRLDPPHLGTVKIDVSYREGTLHAHLIADSAQVNTLLREKAHDLQRTLRMIGINADTVSVSVGSEGGETDHRSASEKRHDEIQQQLTQLLSDENGWTHEFDATGFRQAPQFVDHWVA